MGLVLVPELYNLISSSYIYKDSLQKNPHEHELWEGHYLPHCSHWAILPLSRDMTAVRNSH